MNLILKDRVRWDDLTPKGNPFEFPGMLFSFTPLGISLTTLQRT